ncbi:MAG: hypothetical protein MO852_16815 [Candidatus Devosia euplotis]|nr:hypothetical protein [Candidatus Devosia euplotis]
MGAADLMLYQIGSGRDWVTGPLEPPYGRDINIKIQVDSLAPLLAQLDIHRIGLFQPLETKRYHAGTLEIVQHQFCVQDPDGYLLRFCQRG